MCFSIDEKQFVLFYFHEKYVFINLPHSIMYACKHGFHFKLVPQMLLSEKTFKTVIVRTGA